jgi:hypothetical protein
VTDQAFLLHPFHRHQTRQHRSLEFYQLTAAVYVVLFSLWCWRTWRTALGSGSLSCSTSLREHQPAVFSRSVSHVRMLMAPDRSTRRLMRKSPEKV